jgi:branched-chain amino acid transport system substrate-binding protein
MNEIPDCMARGRITERGGAHMRRNLITPLIAISIATFAAIAVAADEPIRIGMALPMTGVGFNAVGRQVLAGARLYIQQHGDQVVGRKVELIVRDDQGIADVGRRLVQEMIVKDRVAVVAGGITPTVFAISRLVTEAKIATVVMVSGASVTVDRSPYFVRSSFTMGQSAGVLGQWAASNGSRRIVTLVSDWAPGIEAETAFRQAFTQAGGVIIDSIRVPLANPDFAPFLQRIRDTQPDTAFVYFPGPQAGIFARQFAERGLGRSGIKMIGPGDLTDDDELNGLGDQMLGLVTAQHYSTAHASAMNQAYVQAFRQANGFRPNFISVGGYDAMHLIYEALKKTGGSTDGDAVVSAMRNMQWESPRGPVSIDPQTRDIVQNIYMRKVERVDGELQNVEFATFEAIKDPLRPTNK